MSRNLKQGTCELNPNFFNNFFYSVFQGFRQAKSANDASMHDAIFDTAPAASKNEARFKSVKVYSKIIISLPKI